MRLDYKLGVFCALLWSSFAAVRNESDLSVAIAAATTGGVIEFQANIVLAETVDVPKSLTIMGNSFDLDGNNAVRCINIATSSTTVTIFDLKVTAGSSSDGGAGIYVTNAALIMNNCSITGNELSDRASGGGLAVDNAGTATLTDCTISNNGALTRGNYGGAAYFGAGVTAVLTRCFISDSYNCQYGGAVAVKGATVTFDMCTFSGNTGYTINKGKSIYAIEDSTGTAGEVILSACTLESDQSVYLSTGGTIVHHSGCAANTSLSGSGDRSATVDCTDTTSTWCPSSALVADLLTNASCSACGSEESACCGATTCSTSTGACSDDYCFAPAPTTAPTKLSLPSSQMPTALPTFLIFDSSSAPTVSLVSSPTAIPTTVSLVSSPTAIPTAAPTSNLLAGQQSVLVACISIAGALFVAGVALSYARGAMVNKASKSKQKGKDASAKVTTNTKQKQRPTRDEKVAALELPPELFDEEAPRATSEFQKKEVPNKKRPTQSDNVLIQQDLHEGVVSTPVATTEIDLKFEHDKNGENAMELEKFGKLVVLGYTKEMKANEKKKNTTK